VGALFATSAAAVLVLCATRPHLAGPVATAPADDLARASCWVIAAVCTAWLSGTALASSIAFVGEGAGGVRRVVSWAPPIARHALRAALAGSLAVAPVPPPVTVHVGTDGRLAPGTRPSPARTTTTTAPRPPVRQRPAPSHRSLPPRRATSRAYRVQPGDNLWSIARAELARHLRRDPRDGDTAPYWLRVIDANRATLRSGDPNLIYPGEIVELPNP